MVDVSTPDEPFPRSYRFWPLLLPGAYAVHIAEELGGGPGFAAWMSTHFFPDFTLGRFVWINAVAWPVMLAVCVAAGYSARQRWLAVPVAVLVVVNGLLHLGSTLLTGTYSPGLISGLVLYLPIGGWALRRVGREAPDPHYGGGAALGIAIHGLVVLLASGVIVG